MSIAKKDRFIQSNLKIPVDSGGVFPPPEITYQSLRLHNLGTSNKSDLLPVNIDTMELQRAVTYGAIGQFIFSATNGDLYDACLYINEDKEVFIYGIRTRQMPDKPKKSKINKEELK